MFKIYIPLLLTFICFVNVKSNIICTKLGIFSTCIPEADDHQNNLQRGSVSDNEDLEEIYMSGCKLTTIESDAFDELPSLLKLVLADNSLNITESIFNNLGTLKSLNMTKNLLPQISSTFLQPLAELETLDLSSNRIAEIDNGAFIGNSKIVNLYLSNNLLYGIQPGTFDSLSMLTFLDLSKNRMSTLTVGVFDSCKNLNFLDLSSSGLSPIPSGLFNSLIELSSLYLCSNNISFINPDDFEFNYKLRMLDLSDNALSTIEENTFGSLVNLKLLNVSRNRLSDASFIIPLKQLASLDVSVNRLQSFPTTNSTLIKVLDISDNQFTNLGMNVGILIPRKLTKMLIHRNPWQCSCLEQIVGLLQRRNISYLDKTYFSGKRPVCIVPEKSARCSRDLTRQDKLYNIYMTELKKYF